MKSWFRATASGESGEPDLPGPQPSAMVTALRTLSLVVYPLMLFTLHMVIPLNSPAQGTPGLAWTFKVFVTAFANTCVPTSWALQQTFRYGKPAFIPLVVEGQLFASALVAVFCWIIGTYVRFPIPYGFFVQLVSQIIFYEPVMMMKVLERFNPGCFDGAMGKQYETHLKAPPTLAMSFMLLEAYVIGMLALGSGPLWTIMAILFPVLPGIYCYVITVPLLKLTGDSSTPLILEWTVYTCFIYTQMVIQTVPNVHLAVYYTVIGAAEHFYQYLIVAGKVKGNFLYSPPKRDDYDDDALFQDDMTEFLGQNLIVLALQELMEIIVIAIRVAQVYIIFYSVNAKYVVGFGVEAYGQGTSDKAALDQSVLIMLVTCMVDTAFFVCTLAGLARELKTCTIGWDFPWVPWAFFLDEFYFTVLAIIGAVCGSISVSFVLLHDGMDFTGDVWRCVEPSNVTSPVCPLKI
jgi:hypothetical protein